MGDGKAASENVVMEYMSTDERFAMTTGSSRNGAREASMLKIV